MPELPEAETIVRGLRETLPGSRIEKVRVLHPDVIEGDPAAFASHAKDQVITGISRRGKNIVVIFDRGHQIVVNLGMSGRLLLRLPDDPTPPPSHPAVLFELSEVCGTLVYHDVRRFGLLRILSDAEYRAWSGTLGPEPLGRSFTCEQLARTLARSRSPIRSWLLDQRRIAGIGNIYANEALFRAGVHPAAPADSIAPDRVGPLHRSLRRVLRDAIAARGTTLRDYRTAQGWEGSYGGQLRVYGREGEPCVSCRTPVERLVFANRSAFFCPRCQPRPSP